MDVTLSSLRSDGSSKRLEQISRLRARGIGEHVNLPQLVVCGDQSAGKSSVLEGVTGLPFPRQEGLCTRFATEITLTHTGGSLATEAEIIPHATRSDEGKQKLLHYKRKLERFDELPDIIAEVSDLMELRGPKFPSGPSFTNDVLRIKVSGSTGLHLTVVDLPGLISVASEDQTEEDVQTVHNLVNTYLENQRTIILAVVQASNDIANQGIIQKSKRHDPQGARTVGIITKPDLINPGTEPLIAALAKNQGSTKLKLGFFMVKNPSPADRATVTASHIRERREQDYFRASPWKELRLDMTRVGVAALRTYLQRLLDRHIEQELPAVRASIEAFLKETDNEIVGLGDERPTCTDIRRYLTRVANRFHNLSVAALGGSYHNTDVAFFAVKTDDRRFIRLRALMHELNMDFSRALEIYGSTCKVATFANMYGDSKCAAAEVPDPFESLKRTQEHITEADMEKLVTKMYRETRGPELPGNHNYVLLAELFRYQSERWKAFATAHLNHVSSYLTRFVEEVIRHINTDNRVQRELFARVRSFLAKNKAAAVAELNKICLDKDAHPITYNHYFTDNVQKARHDRVHKKLKLSTAESTEQMFTKVQFSNPRPGGLFGSGGPSTNSGSSLFGNAAKDSTASTPLFASSNVQPVTEQMFSVNALKAAITVSMDEQGVAESRDGYEAYYKVARKTFVDNVCIQVIERHLLRDLPMAFSCESVADLSDDELERIAGEDENTVSKRKELRALYADLLESLHELQQM